MKNGTKKIVFSAPAKIHLIGEHSVVYGKPAIISAINLRLTLELIASRHPELVSGSINKRIHSIQSAIETQIKKTYKLKTIPSYEIKIASDFPFGSGLGASASISATLTAAILKLLKIEANKQQIYDVAIAGEKATHGNPSGSDLAAIIFGGTIWFRKETKDLKFISPLNLPPLTLFALDSGTPVESTGVMVAKVAKLPPPTKKKYFDELELLTKNLTLKRPNIKEIFKEANLCLTKLGVVSKSTQKLISQIEKSGGAAKITGAGGFKNGSGMIIVYHEKPEKLKGLKLIKIKHAQGGLQLEQ